MFTMLLAAALAQQPDTAQLELYRFWRAPDETAVVGMVTVPLSQLTFTADAAPARQVARYTMRVAFRDASGMVLSDRSWTQSVTRAANEQHAGARAAENVAVNLKPGRYRVEVTVRDSVSGKEFSLSRAVEAPGRPPAMGDLILGHQMRRAASDEAAPAGTLALSGLIIAPDLDGEVPEGSVLVLYTEVYPGARAGDTATVAIVLEGTAAAFRQELPVARRRYAEAGGLETLRLPLEGVLPGEYRVSVRVAYGDTTVVTSRPLRITGREAQDVESDLFAGYSEAQLDTIFAAAQYVATPDEQRVYGTLSAAAKHRFLNRFWGRRDPTPGLPNEYYDEYRRRVAYANENFGVRSGAPGWASARGRIYILHGPPADRYVQSQVGRGGADRPFEMWKYPGGRQPKYVFLDQAGFGNYQLIYSSDPNEQTMPDWRKFFDRETLGLIDRF